jgi:hypothetical protein
VPDLEITLSPAFAADKASIFGHAETLVAGISEAMRRYKLPDGWTATSKIVWMDPKAASANA